MKRGEELGEYEPTDDPVMEVDSWCIIAHAPTGWGRRLIAQHIDEFAKWDPVGLADYLLRETETFVEVTWTHVNRCTPDEVADGAAEFFFQADMAIYIKGHDQSVGFEITIEAPHGRRLLPFSKWQIEESDLGPFIKALFGEVLEGRIIAVETEMNLCGDYEAMRLSDYLAALREWKAWGPAHLAEVTK